MAKNRLAWLGVGAVVCMALGLSNCTANGGAPIHTGTPVPDAVGKVVNLDQGWTEAEQQFFWYGPQGSQLIPYDWFLALEQPSQLAQEQPPQEKPPQEKPPPPQLFRSDSSLRRYRFLLSKPSRSNPDGLPVGFARSRDKATGQSWVGWTCAACHTGQIQYKETALRIDGGPMIADPTTFQDDLVIAMRETTADGAKFDRFAHKVLGTSYSKESASALSSDVDTQREQLATRFAVDHPAKNNPYGNGRLDAFDAIFNQVLGTDLKDPKNYRLADAPVSVPFLWDTPYLDLVQWNGIAPNFGVGPLARNVGEVLGVFGTIEIEKGRSSYPSSANIPSLGKLEKTLGRLWSPQWPEAYLPALDHAKVERGGALYRQNCASCHALTSRTDPHRKINVVMTPMAKLGTDPVMATNAATRTANSDALKGAKTYFLVGERFGDTALAADLVNHIIIGAILDHPLKSVRAITEDLENVKFQLPKPHEAYKARPLDGIWATAPYLHNGSVPSLWQLLQPATARMPKFNISTEFDPVSVGFETKEPGSFELDTALPGNSNLGHTYGTQLTEAEKWDLIEFMKSI